MNSFLYQNPITKIITCEKLCVCPSEVIKCNGRNSNGLIFCLEGNSKYEYSGGSFTASANSLFFLPKGLEYLIYRDTYSEFIYVNFETAEKVTDLPFSVIYSNSSAIKDLFASALRAYNGQKSGFEASVMSTLYKIVSTVQLNDSFRFTPSPQYKKISHSVEYINENCFTEQISTPLLAEMCGMSVSGFSHQFKSEIGVSPGEYLLQQRLSAALFLLENTGSSISDIAQRVGFEDGLYFSKFFRSRMGMSPSDYRNYTIKGKQKE